MKQEHYQKCIDACIECATECNHCAVACLEEKDVQYLTKCVRLNLECAIMCRAAAEVMTLGSNYTRQMCDLCAEICTACAEICEQHANMEMEHCRECAEACRTCANELMEVYKSLEEAEGDTKSAIFNQDECAIFTRVSSELMSLDSTYCKQICALTASICSAASKTLEINLTREISQSKQRALISSEVHKHLENLKQPLNKDDESVAQEKSGQKVQQKGASKSMSKHSSALLAASMWRSPVSHAFRHTSGGLLGSYANMGTNVSYEEEDI